MGMWPPFGDQVFDPFYFGYGRLKIPFSLSRIMRYHHQFKNRPHQHRLLLEYLLAKPGGKAYEKKRYRQKYLHSTKCCDESKKKKLHKVYYIPLFVVISYLTCMSLCISRNAV